MRFSVYQLSRVGGRENNEDRVGYCYTRHAALFALADGMGGHPRGEVAAQMALQSLAARFQRQASPRLDDVMDFLGLGMLAAHRDILEYASHHGLPDAPRTTLVAAVIQDGWLQWVHCGDSRLYLVRDNAVLTRTLDHSHAQLQVGLGKAVNRNALFTCLGSVARPAFELGAGLQLVPGDRVLLCSDGLWDSVDEPDLLQMLADQPVAQSVTQLVDRAVTLAGANCDNVTALAVEWEPEGAPDVDHHAATQTEDLGASGFLSTIQPLNASDLDADEWDEHAMEESISEINTAIGRSTPSA